jgi:hypothetical protein
MFSTNVQIQTKSKITHVIVIVFEEKWEIAIWLGCNVVRVEVVSKDVGVGKNGAKV